MATKHELQAIEKRIAEIKTRISEIESGMAALPSLKQELALRYELAAKALREESSAQINSLPTIASPNPSEDGNSSSVPTWEICVKILEEFEDGLHFTELCRLALARGYFAGQKEEMVQENVRRSLNKRSGREFIRIGPGTYRLMSKEYPE